MNREQWLKNRGWTVGASDAPIILNAGYYGDIVSLWVQKKLAQRGEVDASDEPWQEWGRRLEGPICEKAAEELEQAAVLNEGDHTYRHPGVRGMTATPDAFVAPKVFPLNIVSAAAKPVESKVVNFSHDDHDFTAGPRLDHLIQVQHQLAVLGKRVGYIAYLLNHSDFHLHRVEVYPDFVEKTLYPAVDKFLWYLKQDDPPPGVTDKSKSPLLKWYKVRPTEVRLHADFVQLDRELREAKEERAMLDKNIKRMEAIVLAAMREAEVGIVPNGNQYKRVEVGPTSVSFERKGYTKLIAKGDQ